MTAPRRRFKRPLGERRYKKLFVVATEGYITEPQYFKLFQRFQTIVQVKCLKHHSRNSPPQVLKRLQSHLKTENFQKSDEAWLVVDKDDWTDNQLSQLAIQRAENRDNPPCEDWPRSSATTVYRLVKRIIADNQDYQA